MHRWARKRQGQDPNSTTLTAGRTYILPTGVGLIYALMTFAMLGFAIEDMFIKQMAGSLPVGQILAVLGAGGALIFGLGVKLQGQRLIHPESHPRQPKKRPLNSLS